MPAGKVANIVIVILLVLNQKVAMSLMVSANVVQDLVEEDVISVKKITMVILPLNVFHAIVILQDLHRTNAILKLENAIVLKVISLIDFWGFYLKWNRVYKIFCYF